MGLKVFGFLALVPLGDYLPPVKAVLRESISVVILNFVKINLKIIFAKKIQIENW